MALFIRYKNRKLYDPVNSKYVTLSYLAQSIIYGASQIQVIDHATKKDITHAVVLRVLGVQQRAKLGLAQAIYMVRSTGVLK